MPREAWEIGAAMALKSLDGIAEALMDALQPERGGEPARSPAAVE
jgi:hypothetical protein